MMKFATSLFVLMCVAMPCAASEKIRPEQCLGAKEVFIEEKNIAACEGLLKKEKLTANQKSNILMQLGIATLYKSFKKPAEIAAKNKDVKDYYHKAIAADPAYAEPYLILAKQHFGESQYQDALQVLEQGIKALPIEPRLQADKAEVLAKLNEPEKVKPLCIAAMESKTADKSVFDSCASAFSETAQIELADAAYQKALALEDRSTRSRFGIWQASDTSYTYATFLEKHNSPKAAADFLEAYLKTRSPNDVSPYHKKLMAELYQKSGNFAKAAEQFDNLKAGFPRRKAYEMKLAALVNLAKSGDMSGARAMSLFMFEKATKNQILQLQVKLKNGTQRHLKITGKYDADTKSALDACLNDRKCFSEDATPRL